MAMSVSQDGIMSAGESEMVPACSLGEASVLMSPNEEGMWKHEAAQ